MSACACKSGRQEISKSCICERNLSVSQSKSLFRMVMEREREEKGAPREWCKIHDASEIVERWDLQSNSAIYSSWVR